MRCVGQPHKRLAGLIVARTSKSRRKGSSNWKVSEVGVCPRIDGTDGTHETDRANGTDRPEGPWEPSPGFSLGFRFSPYAGLKDRKTSSGAGFYRDPICHRLKIQPTMVRTMLMRMQVASGK